MSRVHRSAALSRDDFARWAAALLRRWGLSREFGFHLVEWAHDAGCPLNQVTNPGAELSSRCECQPDGSLILHVGTPAQRCIPVVLDGVELAPPPPSIADTTH